MPKILLTEQQRTNARYESLRHCIGDRVARTKHQRKLKLMDMASSFNMGHATLAKIMDGEDVTMTTTKFLQILDLAGLALVDKKKDELSRGEAEGG